MSENSHGERAHALLSASGASRWMNCTPSARIEEKFPEKEESIFATEGTLAHEFAELFLLKKYKRIKPAEYKKRLAELQSHELYSEEMDEEVEKFTTYVSEEYAAAQKVTPDAVLAIEEKIDYSEYVKEGFGTCDDIILVDGTMEVIDLKYGKGVKVFAEENEQLMLYGLGALAAFDMFYNIQKVKLTIVQPRLNHNSSWEISASDLKAWGAKTVRIKAALAFDGKGVQKAGSWCKWCKAATRCATLAAVNVKIAKHEFKDPHLLNDDQLLEVYHMFDQISGWIKTVADYMLKEALSGKKWAGLKVVEGKSNRKWKEEQSTIDLLKSKGYSLDQIVNSKIKGIGDIEKLVTKKDFPALLGNHVIKPPGKPALAPLSDKRKEFNSVEQAKEDFK